MSPKRSPHLRVVSDTSSSEMIAPAEHSRTVGSMKTEKTVILTVTVDGEDIAWEDAVDAIWDGDTPERYIVSAIAQ